MTNPLAVRVGGTGSFDLVRFKQGQNAQVLATVPGSPGSLGDHRLNRAAQLGNRLLWIANDKAYQKTGTGSVTEKLTALSGADFSAGWLKYYMHPTNGPGLFGCTHEGSGELVKYDYLTDLWSKTNLGANSGTASFGHQSLCVVDNIGYFTNGTNIFTLNPDAESIVSNSMGAPSVICPFNNIVYMLKATTVNGDPYEFGQFIGGSFIKLSDVTNSQVSTGSGDSSITLPIIYTIGSDVYMACNNSTTNDGWVAGKWDGTTFTEVTNTLLPLQLRPGGSLASVTPDRWRAFCWKVQEGNTLRTFIQFALGYQTTSSILYEHVGNTWVLRNSSQHGSHYCQMSNHEAGGDLYYDENELNAIRISKETTVANGMELEYYVNGDEGTADTFCGLWYSIDSGASWSRATILAPGGGTGGGSSISANNLQGVDADGDGLTPTTYTIIHDFTADGLSSTAQPWWHLRCSKTAF